MGRDTGRLREEIKRRLKDCGAIAAGFAKAEPVDDNEFDFFANWIKNGNHAGMDYLTRYQEIRKDPRLLLEGARTVISMAFVYRTDARRNPELPRIASYAFLPDYHVWIKGRIRKSGIEDLIGEEHSSWRICVDTAPILERYWAVKSGIAIRGENGAAIIPGAGCEVFLAEIITRLEFEPDRQLEASCLGCKKCRNACPGKAYDPESGLDCNRCISYLTIEHKGVWEHPTHKETMSAPEARNSLFGCDRCIAVCPHNNPCIFSPEQPQIETVNYTEGPLPSRSSLKRAGKEGIERNRQAPQGSLLLRRETDS